MQLLREKLGNKKKCFIVGFAPSYREVPWTDKDAEIWTLNDAYALFDKVPESRADRYFEIHALDRPPKNTKSHLAWLKACPLPVYTLKKWDFLPNCIPFPFYEVVDWFKERGHIGSGYFTNSISWMLGLAIAEGFEEIHIYGVDMASEENSCGNGEYQYQKPSCEYLIGVAEQYAKVYVPESSHLLATDSLYAIETDNKRFVYLKNKIDTLQKQIVQVVQAKAQLEAQIEQYKIKGNRLKGARDICQEILRKRV